MNVNNYHQEQNSSNQRISGTGTLSNCGSMVTCITVGIVESEMHGVGTYTFANGKTLQGSFEHNVFVGE